MATGDSNPKGAEPAKAPAKQAESAPNPPPTSTSIDQPKLTALQLKAKAKAEKAARRAAVKEARATAPVQSEPEASGEKGQGKQDAAHKGPGQSQAKTTLPLRPSAMARRPSIAAVDKDARSSIPECFSHLPMAKRIQMSQASKDVHPAVLAVGQQMATFTLRDSIARLEATLLAFRKVIEGYETPKGNSLSRHFLPHVLNHQIEYLTECRPMCIAMGNAIRLLKAKVNNFDIDTPEDEAKEVLLDSIENFLAERVSLAELLISRNAAKIITQGDVILTFGRHKLVEMTLLEAHRNGTKFEALILDDPYDQTGQQLAKALRIEGIQVTYLPHLGGLSLAVERASIILLGAEAFFANGAMYAPNGTNEIALCGSDANIPVIALCETINFDRERIAMDALTYNEIDPDRNSSESLRLLFDVTRECHITGIVTENEGETAVAPGEAILSVLNRQDITTQY